MIVNNCWKKSPPPSLNIKWFIWISKCEIAIHIPQSTCINSTIFMRACDLSCAFCCLDNIVATRWKSTSFLCDWKWWYIWRRQQQQPTKKKQMTELPIIEVYNEFHTWFWCVNHYAYVCFHLKSISFESVSLCSRSGKKTVKWPAYLFKYLLHAKRLSSYRLLYKIHEVK